MNIEGRKESWSPLNTGICKLCNQNNKETILHFVLECDQFNLIRDKMCNNLKNDLLHFNLEHFWKSFDEGSSEMKFHLLIDNLYKENITLGEIFDTHFKKYLQSAWDIRSSFYNQEPTLPTTTKID